MTYGDLQTAVTAYTDAQQHRPHWVRDLRDMMAVYGASRLIDVQPSDFASLISDIEKATKSAPA